MSSINTNIPSLTAQRNLTSSAGSLSSSLQRLSSGLRINSAKDDAAGLSISERMSGQIRGLDQARRNANDGISLSQTAEGSLNSAGGVLQRIRELAVQSANSSNSASDRQALQSEVVQLASELDRIAQTTEFNGLKLLDGTFTSSNFQVGANAFQTINLTSANFRTTAYGLNRVDSETAITNATAGTAIAAAVTAANRIDGGDIIVNGYVGAGTVTVAAGDSAKTIAAGINNKSSATGVTANARTEADLVLATTSQAYVLNIASNNAGTSPKTISFSTGTAMNADGLASAINAFNDVTSTTGVTAQLNSAGTGITLTNETGADIRIAGGTGGVGNTFTFGTLAGTGSAGQGVIMTGRVTLDSSRSFSFTDAAASDDGAIMGTQSLSSSLSSVSTLDVTSFANASKALAIVDSALEAVNGQRAKFGAVQSRFETTISQLAISTENLSSARSRIRDTDFAAETANLSRAQILQQAGTAMLAQANQLPQQVLSLLR